MKAFLDTHVAVYLGSGETSELGYRGLDLVERAALFVSPAVRLELAFLSELRRIRASADQVLGALAGDLGVRVAADPFDSVVTEAMAIGWTRDPFDRLIVATAALHRSPLITRDRRVLDNFADAVW